MVDTSDKPTLDDTALLERFRQYEAGVANLNARRAALIAAVFMVAGASLDLFVFPEYFLLFLIIRIASALLLGGIWMLLRSSGTGIHQTIYAQGIALIPLISICLMIVRTGGGDSVYYAGLNLVLVGLSLLLRWSFLNSAIMIGLCFIAYVLSVLAAPGDSEFRLLFNNLYFLFVTSVFVVAGSFFYERLRFREFKLRVEVEQSHAQLEAQNRQLSELDEAKTRFFANISHELRTPLTIMLGLTEKLQSSLPAVSPDARIAEMLEMLEQNGLRLLKLIDDLLDLVRFDTGHADVSPQPTHLEHHLDGVLRSLRHLAEQDRVALLWTCETDPQVVMVDRDKFDKILLNLVINAIKFTPSGGSIEVSVRAADGNLRLIVEDTGVGMPPEVVPRVFERFWQVDTSSTRKFQGAGIGLALVRSLSEAMKGTVTVESQVGVGTKFIVNLPVDAADAATVAEDADDDPLGSGGTISSLHRRAALSSRGKLRGHSPSQPSGIRTLPLKPAPTMIGGRPSGARPLVLIADDEPDIRRFLRMQLEDVDVIEASDGAEALELARLRQPQLALLDHMMPEMDGVDVCREIRNNHATRNVAVIILTARADERTKLEALEAGASDFLTKPFSSAELGLRLRNQLTMAKIRRDMADLNTELQTALDQIKENEVLMVRNEKLSALGRMSAGIIHEINNPLNYATAGIHMLATYTRCLPDDEIPDFEDTLKDIREGIERVSQIVIDLRQFTRDEKSTAADIDLVEILTRARRMIGHQIGNKIAFDITAPERAPIGGNANQLVQVFINLFQNGIDAIAQRIEEHGGEPGRISAIVEPAGDGWQVTTRDNGIGIPPENLQKIFDPFFTSKDVGKGMGLGLAITHQILKSHNAIIEVDSRPAKFTMFRIAFPGRSYSDGDADELDASVLDQSV